MNSTRPKKQAGFVLVITLILLVVVAVLTMSGIRGNVMSEKMLGAHLERTRAKASAEQAVTQGLALLQANADTCLTIGCTNDSQGLSGPGFGSEQPVSVTNPPSTWSAVSAHAVSAAGVDASQSSSALFVINHLAYSGFTSSNQRAGCKAYVVTGRGSGRDSKSLVTLQTVAYVCPAD